jgi:hypothetical protein
MAGGAVTVANAQDGILRKEAASATMATTRAKTHVAML